MLLSVPHSGRDYPDWLVEMAPGGSALDSRGPAGRPPGVAGAPRGVGAVIARAPRAAVDCNRAEDEVDPSVIEGRRRERVSARARGGLGIVPARTAPSRLFVAARDRRRELDERLDQAHRPYHRALADPALAAHRSLRRRDPARLPFDAPAARRHPADRFGDRRGRTAGSGSARSPRHRQAAWVRSRLNEPFAGGPGRTARCPARNVHALQIEIDRRVYLDGL